MKNGLAIAALLIGALGGYFVGASDHSHDEETHGAHMEESGHMTHELRDVEGEVPEIDLTILGDANNGFDAQVIVSNFVFAPQNVNGEDVAGEGHAHIYINGEKKSRVYGEWYNIGKLPVGSHEVEIRLSSNDHHELALEGEVIKKNTVIVVREDELAGGEHMHMEEEHHDESEEHSHEEE